MAVIDIPVSGGTFTANSGDIFNIAPSATGNITVNGATDFIVNIQDDLAGSGADNDTIIGGSGSDTLDGGSGSDSILGGAWNATLIGGAGSDTLQGGSNNDFIDLLAFYDHISKLYADQADDGILNHSNTTDTHSNTVDYTDNAPFVGVQGITFRGASADSSSFTVKNRIFRKIGRNRL